MAVSQNTLIGRTRGSVGGVTFTKWKGLNVLKSKPEEVENPQTIPQQTQRNRLALMVLIYRQVAAAVQVGFKELAVNQSEYNAFVSDNIMTAIQVTVAPAVDAVANLLRFAKGALSPTAISSASSADGSATVTINFSNTVDAPDQALSDIAYAIAMNEATGEIGQALGTALRSDGSIDVILPGTAAAGSTINCYLFFKEDGSDRCSDSVWFQTVTV